MLKNRNISNFFLYISIYFKVLL